MALDVAPEYRMMIDGASTAAETGEWTDVRSPASGAVVGRVPLGDSRDVDRAVAAARSSFRDGRWRAMWLPERVAVLNRLADLLDANADELARIETLQTGTAYKLRRESDIPFTADNLRFFAGRRPAPRRARRRPSTAAPTRA